MVPAYTLKTVWDTTSQNDPETGLPKNTYTETVTVEPTANASIVTAPEAVTVNIDGNNPKIIKSFRSVRTALLQTTERQQSNMYLKICCVVVLSE